MGNHLLQKVNETTDDVVRETGLNPRVSCEVMATLEEHMRLEGVTLDELTKPLSVSAETIRDEKAEISWNEFVELIERVAQLMGDRFDEYVRHDFDLIREGSASHLTALLRIAVKPAHLYKLQAWSQRTYASFIGQELDVVGPDHLKITMTVPTSLRWSGVLWTAVQAIFEGLPRVLRRKDATVHWTGDERARTYDIHLPDALGFWGRLARAWRVLVDGAPEDEFIELHKREVERGLAALHEEIRRRSELESELQHAEKLELVGQIAGGVAHDFNNQLAILQTSLELMASPKCSESQRQKLLERCSLVVRQSSHLTGRLLAFSRHSARNPRLVDVAEHIGNVELLLSGVLPATIQLVCVAQDGEDGLFVRSDPGYLETALMNLVVNAQQALEGSGMIVVKASGDEESVTVSVEDDGPGIPAELRGRAVDPFFTTKQDAGGTGLGLAMVQRFVDDSGGFFEISSGDRGGALVRLTLPRAFPKEQDPPSRRQIAHSGQGKKILLTEDNRELAAATGAMLEFLQYRVVTASDASSALQVLDESFDLLLSDIVLPGNMTGAQLGEEARRRFPELKVLLMTGYVPEQVGIEPEQPVLLKPFGTREVSEALERLLFEPSRAKPNHRRS